MTNELIMWNFTRLRGWTNNDSTNRGRLTQIALCSHFYTRQKDPVHMCTTDNLQVDGGVYWINPSTTSPDTVWNGVIRYGGCVVDAGNLDQ